MGWVQGDYDACAVHNNPTYFEREINHCKFCYLKRSRVPGRAPYPPSDQDGYLNFRLARSALFPYTDEGKALVPAIGTRESRARDATAPPAGIAMDNHLRFCELYEEENQIGSDSCLGSHSDKTGQDAKPLKVYARSVGAEYHVSEGEMATLIDVTKGYLHKIQRCADASFKSNSNIQGWISASWKVEKGKVRQVSVIWNQTGDIAIGTCVANAVRSFRFDAGITASVNQYTWFMIPHHKKTTP